MESKRIITVDDIEVGDGIGWYAEGFRCDNVTKIDLLRHIVITERYGEIHINQIQEVLIHKDGKTVKKFPKLN